MARLRLDVAQRRGYNSMRAELHLARPSIARGRHRRLERSAQGCDRRRARWRKNSGDDRVGIDRDHGIVAGIDAFGRTRRACATDRVRIATVDAAIVSGSSAGPSRDGFDADEHGGEHAWTWQRRDAARIARDARFGIIEPAARRCFERDVHLFGDQHQFGSIDSGNSDCDPGRSRVGPPDGYCRHGIFRDSLRGDCRGPFGKIFRAIAGLPASGKRRVQEKTRADGPSRTGITARRPYHSAILGQVCVR